MLKLVRSTSHYTSSLFLKPQLKSCRQFWNPTQKNNNTCFEEAWLTPNHEYTPDRLWKVGRYQGEDIEIIMKVFQAYLHLIYEKGPVTELMNIVE